MAELSHAEAVKLGLEPAGAELSDEEARKLGLAGEPGNPGPNPYAPGQTEAQRAQANNRRAGDYKDAAISWADNAALGGGPQISGVIGAIANAAVSPGTNDLDAYRSVRDESAKRIASAEGTAAGQTGALIGAMSTPGLPAVAKGDTKIAGMVIPTRVIQATKVGGLTGGLNAAFRSPQDLTRPDAQALKRFLLDTGGGVVGGSGGGLIAGSVLGATAKPARAVAETQALRAAGLEAGIKNSVRKDLGVPNMVEARAIGRDFLDEGLVPVVGSSEAVGARASKLAEKSGAEQQAALREAERSGIPADEVRNANAPRRMLFGESATADELSGAKARALADALEKQGERTPGSYVGLNKAKSDAWKSANFDADAPMAAQLYRKAVGAARDDLENQVSNATSPENAKRLSEANRKYGIAADALKLSENASTRAGARKGLTPFDIAALFAGVGGGAAGQPAEAAAITAASMLGKRAFDNYGHSSAARFADFLANRSGGGVGGQGGAELARWSKFLKPDEEQQ